MGHDGPDILELRKARRWSVPDVYHGKVGRGLSVEMSVRNGLVTLLSVVEDPANGKFLLLIAEEPSRLGQGSNREHQQPFSVSLLEHVALSRSGTRTDRLTIALSGRPSCRGTREGRCAAQHQGRTCMLRLLAAIALASGSFSFCTAQVSPTAPQKITVDWDKDQRPLKTTASLQVVVNPLLRRGSQIHDRAFTELESLGADYVRYVPWTPYPRLAVAELDPPTKEKTSWDFSLIDPIVIDFLACNSGTFHHHELLHSAFMAVCAEEACRVSADPNGVQWDYVQGKELRDPGGTELADYYGRLVSWYTKGGFKDELGHSHESENHFSFPWWEVFNEIDGEHQPTPEQYVTEYDAVVLRLQAIDPQMKFVGLALAFPERNPDMVSTSWIIITIVPVFLSTWSAITSTPLPALSRPWIAGGILL